MSAAAPRTIGGRYVLHDELASGGMATVHLGRLIGAAGFSRTVAIKRLHPQYAKQADFVSMFIDEARIAARIRHPNVVATLDTVSVDGELFLIMELVLGDTLSRLAHAPATVPVEIAVAIASGVLHGLNAAHEARDERGVWLEIVHRDVSPQNVIVGADGLARVLDFGVAKALGRLQTTRQGEVKGKVAYMAPEQLRGGKVDRRTDVYAAAVVLWETLAGRRLFVSDSPAETMARVLEQPVEPPSRYAPGVPPAIDAVVMRGLRRDPALRFATAQDMATALEQAIALPSQSAIARWVTDAAGDRLTARAAQIARIDSDAVAVSPPPVEAAPHAPSELVTTPALLRHPRASRTWVVAALAAAATLAVVAGGVSVRSCVHAEPTVAASEPTTPPPPAGTPAAATAAPPAAAIPAAPGVDAGPAVTPRAVSAKKRPVAPPTAKKRPSCNPPYTIDADGVHIPKKECR